MKEGAEERLFKACVYLPSCLVDSAAKCGMDGCCFVTITGVILYLEVDIKIQVNKTLFQCRTGLDLWWRNTFSRSLWSQVKSNSSSSKQQYTHAKL